MREQRRGIAGQHREEGVEESPLPLVQTSRRGDVAGGGQERIFIIEALLLVWVFAYLLRKWEVSRLHPAWFVILSLIGSIAFALPVALLWRTKGGVTPPRE